MILATSDSEETVCEMEVGGRNRMRDGGRRSEVEGTVKLLLLREEEVASIPYTQEDRSWMERES